MPSNAYTLLYGLYPNSRSKNAILEMIRQAGLSRSMLFITWPILAGLTRLGETELCRSLLADGNAWLRMLREGATTTWEGWGKDSKWNTSLFHLCLTYPIHFLCDWGMGAALDFNNLME
jgi:hypothetical protein